MKNILLSGFIVLCAFIANAQTSSDEQLRKETMAAIPAAEKVFLEKIRPFLQTNPSFEKVLAKIEEQKQGRGEERLLGNSIIYYLYATRGEGEVKGPVCASSKLFGPDGNGGPISKACENVVKAQNEYIKRFPFMLTAGGLNQSAWTIFEASQSKSDLNAALKWSEKSLELTEPQDKAACTDTYANILYKLGRKAEAIEWAEKAIKLAPDDDYNKEILAKMKSGEQTWP